MAKTEQDETLETSGRDQSDAVRNFREAGREAELALRRFQAAEFRSGMRSRPYGDLLRDAEWMTRQWTQGVRTLEQTFDIAPKRYCREE
jgi:hypothetical protein